MIYLFKSAWMFPASIANDEVKFPGNFSSLIDLYSDVSPQPDHHYVAGSIIAVLWWKGWIFMSIRATEESFTTTKNSDTFNGT